MIEKLCVDEQMVHFKERHHLKVLLKSKKKAGIQSICSMWFRCSRKFIFEAVALHPDLPDVKLSGNVVLRLSNVIPEKPF